MMCLEWSGLGRVAVSLLILLGGLAKSSALAQEQGPDAPAANGQNPGQFFVVEQPIDSDEYDGLKAAIESYLRDAAAKGQSPIVLLEIQPGDSQYGTSYQLADFIARKLGAAQKTVAYVPEPLSGYAVLVALACDEIVMGPEATLGPIAPDGDEPSPEFAETVAGLARRKGRSPDLAIGMLNPSAKLFRVQTADGRTDYVLDRNLDEYQQTHQILNQQPAWEAGARGELTAEQARQDGLVQRLAESRRQVAQAYKLSQSADDPLLADDELVPVWIKVSGPVDSSQESYLSRQIAQAREQRANLLILEFDSPGGQIRVTDDLAQQLADLDRIKTVAYIHDRALGLPTLMALACDEIVFHRDGKLGNIVEEINRGGETPRLDDRQRQVIADRAADLADRNGYPTAVARAFVQPEIEVVDAFDRDAGAVILVSRETIEQNPDRFEERQTLESDAQQVLTITSDGAGRFGLSQLVVADDSEFKRIYNLSGRTIRVAGPTWVDALVSTLNTPFMSGLLLFLGFFMLVLEMKLPGIGLPAITATLAFLLFFWSHYLGGTADGLEIILFVVGLICLALELFVFPGFGIFGMSGVLLVLISVVMASHTFVWPTEASQYRQMGRTLLQIVLSLVGVFAGAVILARYFPSLPFFNKLVLKPEPEAPVAEEGLDKPNVDAEAPLSFLLGETGRTTTVLRPSGKARIGDLLVDVTADGFFIEQGSPVQVVDVQGARVIVKKI